MFELIELFLVTLAIFSPVFVTVFIVLHFKHKTKTELRRSQIHEEQTSNQITELQREVAELKERIKVLEVIVTDSGYDTVKALNAIAG